MSIEIERLLKLIREDIFPPTRWDMAKLIAAHVRAHIHITQIMVILADLGIKDTEYGESVEDEIVLFEKVMDIQL